MTPKERDDAVLKACVLVRSGKEAEAMRLCNDVLNEDADHVGALSTAAEASLKVERFGLAYQLNLRCMELLPSEPACISNAAICAAAIPGKLDQAEALARRALKANPQSKAALNVLAQVMVHQCRPKEAIAFAERSLAIDPDQWEAREKIGYANLLLGNFAAGWDGYEAQTGQNKYRKDFTYGGEPKWEGQTGGKLIVRGEQGIGDEISFASILPDAMQDNAITLECDKRLVGLFKRSFPELEIHGTKSESLADWADGRKWDWHCLIGSLAQKYRRSAESFTGKPFLVADPERVEQWKLLLDRLPGLKVGIAWTGGLRNTFRDRRSLSLETLRPILEVEGCSFVSLQYRDPTDEIAASGLPVTHWARAAQAQDYDDVAAIVAGLDLVISVTTAVVDCAGGLGKECWVLVPSKPHWRYGMTGDRKVWYDSVRLYRQRGTDWGRIVQQVAGDLKARCSTSS